MRSKYYSRDGDLDFVQKFYEVMQSLVPSASKDYIKSLRRPKSFCRYLTSLYLYEGKRVPKHYIEAAKNTSLPELQELAEKVARRILFQESEPEKKQDRSKEELVISQEAAREGLLQQTIQQQRSNIIIGFTSGNKGSSGNDRLLRWTKRDKPSGMEEWMETVVRIGKNYYGKLMRKRKESSDFTLKPFQIGDDPNTVDFEATIQNLNDQGKKPEFLSCEDLLIRKPRKRRYSVVFLHDISISMHNMIFFTNAILSTLLQVFRDDDFAIGLFGDDFYVMKELGDYEDIDNLSFAVMALEANGGTMLIRGIDWAEEQFKSAGGEAEKVCVILSDFKIYSLQLTYEKIKELARNNVRIIGISTSETQAWRENICIRVIDVSKILNNTEEPEELLCEVLDNLYIDLFFGSKFILWE